MLSEISQIAYCCLEKDIGDSLVAQLVKNTPAMEETLFQFLGQEDFLEEGMATHSSILSWRVPKDRGAWWATVHWVAKNWTRMRDSAQHSTEKELEKLKSLLKVKEESEKAGLKLNIQKTKIMASDPITSWQIDAETMETLKALFSWTPKSLWTVTAAMKLKDAYPLEEKQ